MRSFSRILSTVNYNRSSLVSSLVDLPAPSNLSFAWNFGSLLGMLIFVQVFTGIVLTLTYNSYVPFECMDILAREYSNGSLLRNLHSVGASLIFVALYIHILRSFFLSTNSALVWVSGMVLYLMLIVISFLGYTLPYGTMSYWAATVILSLATLVMPVEFLYSDYVVSTHTIIRVYTLHFLLPFLLLVVIMGHVLLLHTGGSSSFLPITRIDSLKIHFHPLYTLKDSLTVLVVILVLLFISSHFADYSYHHDNFIPANPLVTPAHIEPEWYFLWLYAILRAFPTKLSGVVAIVVVLLLLFTSCSKRISFPWVLSSLFVLLTYLGACEPSYPYDILSLISYAFLVLLLC